MIIKVGFSRENSIISNTISKIERTPYSHTYIVFTVVNKEMVFQAAKGIVHLITYDLFKLKSIVVKEYVFEADDRREDDFLSFVYSMLGIPYSFTEIIWIFFKKLLKLRKWGYPFNQFIDNGKTEVICSELVMRTLICLELVIKNEDLDLDQITPSELDDVIKKLF